MACAKGRVFVHRMRDLRLQFSIWRINLCCSRSQSESNVCCRYRYHRSACVNYVRAWKIVCSVLIKITTETRFWFTSQLIIAWCHLSLNIIESSLACWMLVCRASVYMPAVLVQLFCRTLRDVLQKRHLSDVPRIGQFLQEFTKTAICLGERNRYVWLVSGDAGRRYRSHVSFRFNTFGDSSAHVDYHRAYN